MPTVTKRENYRVVIEPKVGPYWRGATDERIAEDEKKVCKEIEEQIRRHVDDVQSIEIQFDESQICTHCNRTWELDEETGEPTCCDKAIEEFNNEKTKSGYIKE